MRGSLRDGRAYRQAVAQPLQPDVDRGTAYAPDERLLEIDGPDETRPEAAPVRQQAQLRRPEDPPRGIALRDGGDPLVVGLDMPRLGLVRRQVLGQVALQEATAEVEHRQPEAAGFPADQGDADRAGPD